MESLDELRERLLDFARERDWEQFQSPKNLSMALAVEASELLECFQWLSEAQSGDLDEEQRRQVAGELADVQLYLLLLSARLDMDIIAEAKRKMKANEERYPVEKVRGQAQNTRNCR